MFSTPSPQRWAELATTLGLVPYAHVVGYSHGMSFRQVQRALVSRAGPEPSFGHWLCGQSRGADVAVLTYTVGSGSSTVEYTGALARIDPPLFLGLGVTGHGFFDRLFGASDIRLGHPEIDKALQIEGFEPERVGRLLDPRDGGAGDVLSRMLEALAGHELHVSDSVVCVSREGTLFEPPAIVAMLERAVALSDALRLRRGAVPPSDGERAQQTEWQRFALAHDLSFDPPRMIVRGTAARAYVHIALETEGQLVRTAVTTRFPQSVGVGFAVRPTACPSFLQGLFSQDIDVGDPEFDRSFRVTGVPEAAVRAALARPTLLRMLTALTRHCVEIQLTDTQLFMRLPGACPRAADLEPLLATSRTATDQLFGELRNPAPYR